MFCSDPFAHANFDAKFVALLHRFSTSSNFRAPLGRFKKPANTALESRPNWAESAASFAIFNTSFSATKAHETLGVLVNGSYYVTVLSSNTSKKEIDSPSNSIVNIASF